MALPHSNQPDPGHLAAVVRSAHVAIVSMSLEGRFLSWNAGAQRLFGFSVEESLGADWTIIVPDDRHKEVAGFWVRAQAGEAFVAETVCRHRAGRLVMVAMSFAPVRDETGNVVATSAVCHNIVDRSTVEHRLELETATRHLAEVALEASLRDFRTFFEMANMGNVIADARTSRFLRVNRRFCEMTGYSAEELLNLSSDDLTDPADVERDRSGWAEAIRLGAPNYSIEKRYRCKDGGTIWVHVTSTLVRNTFGEPVHAIGIIRDVTDRRQLVEELQKARAELEGRVASRTAELTAATLVARESMTEREFLERALLEAAERESRRIGQELHDHLCQHLLGAAFSAKAVAMGLSPELPASAELHRLAGLINSAVQQARDIARGLNPVEIDAAGLMIALQELAERPRAGMECRLECSGQVLLRDAGAALHAYRIAQEAVANAVAHSGGSEIVIRLAEDGRNIFLQIQDNGRGFTPHDQGRDGLGLEIMKYRAHALSGKVRIDTAPGRGTNVILLLPK